jgi:hypothetical protein
MLSKAVHIVIPDSVKSIANAFIGCTSLTSIVIPNSVSNIEAAFMQCTSLKSIALHEFFVRGHCRAFFGCASLDQHQSNGNNYHPKPEAWLCHRFDNLPIHQICYQADLTEHVLSIYHIK